MPTLITPNESSGTDASIGTTAAPVLYRYAYSDKPLEPAGPIGPAGPAGPPAPTAPSGPAGPMAPPRLRGPSSPVAPVAPLRPEGRSGRVHPSGRRVRAVRAGHVPFEPEAPCTVVE